MVGALVAALLPAGVPTTAVPGDGGCAAVVDGGAGTWTRRPVPAFPHGPRHLQAHAVDPGTPSRQLLSNGVAILASTDGCAWREVWRMPERPSAASPVSSVTDRVVELVWHPRVHDRVWAVAAVGHGVAERLDVGLPLTPAGDEGRDPTTTLVLRSDDAGQTWTSGGVVPGTPGRLATAPSDPDLLHLPTASGLHASRDGGHTWRPLPAALLTPSGGRRPLDGVHAPVLGEVAVHPIDSARLFGRTSIPVRSMDGGLTWTAYDVPNGFTGGPLVAQHSEVPRPVFTGHDFSTTPMVELWLGKDGTRLRRVALGSGVVEGAAWRGAWNAAGDGALLATWDRGNAAAFPDTSLYRLAPDGAVDDVNELDLPFVRGVQADAAGGFHLHTQSELVTLSPQSAPVPVPATSVEIGPFGDTTPLPPEPAALTSPERVHVVPGEPTPLDVALDLPRRPTPLDAYFLIDTSNSFEPDIAAVAEAMADVVRSLRDAGVDAHFGVGELGTTDARRYRRFADIAAPGPELVRGFERLRTGGSRESHLIALHQTATGSGVAGTHGPAVPAGLDPTWRPGSQRTVVLITDVQYSDVDDPEAPSSLEVHRVLRQRGVRVIGLEVVREGGDDGVPGGYAAVEAADAASTTAPTPARRDLERTAVATGSVVPPGGVDCRGNGTVELAPGDPLVCTTTALHVADLSTIGGVVRRVLLSQVDRRRVTVTASGPASVAWTQPRDGIARAVDVLRDQHLRFSGEVACTDAQAGRGLPLTLEARLGRRTLAVSETTVRCGRPATAPVSGAEATDRGSGPVPREVLGPTPAPMPTVTPPVPAPALGAAPGIASAPGSAPGSAPAPLPATGTMPGAAPQPGAVTRDRTQAHPALAHAGGAEGDGDGEPLGPAGPLLAGLVAGMAVAFHRRRVGTHRPAIITTTSRRTRS